MASMWRRFPKELETFHDYASEGIFLISGAAEASVAEISALICAPASNRLQDRTNWAQCERPLLVNFSLVANYPCSAPTIRVSWPLQLEVKPCAFECHSAASRMVHHCLWLQTMLFRNATGDSQEYLESSGGPTNPLGLSQAIVMLNGRLEAGDRASGIILALGSILWHERLPASGRVLQCLSKDLHKHPLKPRRWAAVAEDFLYEFDTLRVAQRELGHRRKTGKNLGDLHVVWQRLDVILTYVGPAPQER